MLPAWDCVYVEANKIRNEGARKFLQAAVMTVNDRVNRHCAAIHSGFLLRSIPNRKHH